MIIEIKYKKLISDIGKRVYEKGFVAANDGNISVRINEDRELSKENVAKLIDIKEMMV
ncbi:MAG: hypothetical protein K0S80_2537 [Neobacillus sp.]|nr:hypothetical protein [Neobacillus sp.]